MQIGQNANEQSGLANEDSRSPARSARAWPVTTSSTMTSSRTGRGRLRRDARASTSAIPSPLTRRGDRLAGLAFPGEPHLQPIVHEVRFLHVQPLQGLRQGDVSLVGANAHVQLVSLAEDF